MINVHGVLLYDQVVLSVMSVSFMPRLCFFVRSRARCSSTSSQLNESTTQIIQTLRVARQRSIARLNDSAHGVFFEINAGDDRYILYQGSSFAARNSSFDRATTLDSGLEISTTFSVDEANFSKAFGTTTAATVTINHTAAGSQTININSFGAVERQ